MTYSTALICASLRTARDIGSSCVGMGKRTNGSYQETQDEKIPHRSTYVMNWGEKVFESFSRAEHVSSAPARVLHHLAEREILEAVHATLKGLPPHLFVSNDPFIRVLIKPQSTHLLNGSCIIIVVLMWLTKLPTSFLWEQLRAWATSSLSGNTFKQCWQCSYTNVQQIYTEVLGAL